jgi:hypothetical protein
MQLFRRLFSVKCEECGRLIQGEGYPGLGPGAICEGCYKRIEAERERQYEESSRKISQQVIDRVNKDFPPEDRDEVLRRLTEYGKARYEHGDQEFMRLAILRLANGDKQKLLGLVKMAKVDYRDILGTIHQEYGTDWLKKYISVKEEES